MFSRRPLPRSLVIMLTDKANDSMADRTNGDITPPAFAEQ